jgi:hypothetical protein
MDFQALFISLVIGFLILGTIGAIYILIKADKLYEIYLKEFEKNNPQKRVSELLQKLEERKQILLLDETSN